MKNIATVHVENREDALKYAYAFMQTQKLNIKECSFFNLSPKKFNKNLLMPTDMLSASYDEENLPAWENFKTNQLHIASPGFTCAACVDTEDKKRVLGNLLVDVFTFNCYGDYEDQAKKAFENILLIHDSLK